MRILNQYRGLPALFCSGLLCFAAPAAAQLPGLNAGTVTAQVDGTAFSANVSIATMDEGRLILTNLSNAVQIQVPDAQVGTFALSVDADGGAVGTILALQVRGRYITPVTGSLTIESLSAEAARGTFAFTGKDLATDASVPVTDGTFEVRLVGGG